jgi:hypothetical protein
MVLLALVVLQMCHADGVVSAPCDGNRSPRAQKASPCCSSKDRPMTSRPHPARSASSEHT